MTRLIGVFLALALIASAQYTPPAGGGGSGTVTSVGTTCGGYIPGNTITTTGVVGTQILTNAQTGTTYAFIGTDCGFEVTFSNASPVAASLTAAGGIFPAFQNGWWTIAKNIGAGDVTITPATGTISGAATLTISTGESCLIVSGTANYEASCSRNIAGANMTLTKTRTGVTYASSVPVPGSTAPGTSVTLAGTSQIFICTGTCTIAVPVPSINVQYCVYNDDNVSSVITLSAIGSSARYENTARTAYGTAGTGTFVSGGAVGDGVCIIGRDSTHYLTVSFKGTWTAD